MFLPETAHQFADAYLEARRAKVPVVQMGAVERAGHHLLSSAARSQDGEMSPREALIRALWAGEVEAAMVLHEALLASQDDLVPRRAVNMQASGEFEAS